MSTQTTVQRRSTCNHPRDLSREERGEQDRPALEVAIGQFELAIAKNPP